MTRSSMVPTDMLQLCPFSALLERELQARFKVHRWFELDEDARVSLLATRNATIRAVVSGGHVGIPTELMASLPALGIVAINGVGYDRVELAEARRRNIRVTTTPGVLTDDVADLAVGLLISLVRAIPAADRFVREGSWPTTEFPLARKVSGRRFGIVGLGQIGLAIAVRLAAFGPVAYCGQSRKIVPYAYHATVLELARASDVLVIAAASNTTTRGIIDGPVLDALGPDGYLVNVSRGALVDDYELSQALVQGRIAGAALDVYSDEPNVPITLRTSGRTVLTPHIASATTETRDAMARAVLANLDAYFAGTELPGAVA
jgi:lactate dehydrogenase-like 2-hydroxyacid dehydrogenase